MTNRVLVGFGAACVLWGMCTVAGQTPKESATSAPGGKLCDLPKGTDVASGSLGVTKDAAFVVYKAEQPLREDARPPQLPPSVPRVYDVARKRTRDLSELLPSPFKNARIRKMAVSPTLPRIAVMADLSGGKMAGCTVDLATGKSRAFKPGSDEIIIPCWAGDDLIVVRAGPKGVKSVTRVGPDGKTQPLPLRAPVGRASADGKTLVVVADPEAKDKPVPLETLVRQGQLLLVTPAGKVLRSAGPLSALRVSQQPMVSPTGKYVAYQQRPGSRPGPENLKDPRGYRVKVLGLTPGDDWVIPGLERAIAVTDRGQVVTRRSVYGLGGQPLVLCDRKGGRRELVAKAITAARVGDRIYYVTPDDPPAIRWVRIPEERKPKRP